MSRSIGNENRDAGCSTARLRIISVWTFIPALAFNIAHGVLFQCELPALGLIPHAFSVGLAIYELGWWERYFRRPQYRIILQSDPEGDKAFSLPTFLVTLLDIVIGISLTGCIVGAYIEMDSRAGWYSYSDASLIIVGTYATLPYIVNALIHGFFLLKVVNEALKRHATFKKPSNCPHCHSSLSGGPSASRPVAETVSENV